LLRPRAILQKTPPRRQVEGAGWSELANPRSLHEEQVMGKAISGVDFINTKRTNFSRYPYTGNADMAAKLSGPLAEATTAIAPSPVAIELKNKINLDKYR